ncbi:MAG: hypothetical protein ACUVRU_11480 [Anaerolineae bacterium]
MKLARQSSAAQASGVAAVSVAAIDAVVAAEIGVVAGSSFTLFLTRRHFCAWLGGRKMQRS